MAANRSNVFRFELFLCEEAMNALRCERYPVLLGDGGAGDLVGSLAHRPSSSVRSVSGMGM
jgi:hypothetical protein